MAPKYRLTYFNLRARAEPIRWIFHYAGQEFEDRRIEQAQWPGVKPTTPFGVLPYLEVDEKPLGGNIPTQRYLARQFGLAGQDAYEEAQADAIVDYLEDAAKDYRQWTAAFMARDQKKMDFVREKYLGETVIPYLQKLEQTLQQNGNGEFIVGNKLTWADFNLIAFLDKMVVLNGSNAVLDNYPLLKAHSDRVHNLKGIKEWLAVRPVTLL